jgi:hypothetical protein
MAIEGREGQQAVFIVRLTRHPAGQVTGVVERVRTGEKERFAGVEGIGPIFAKMLIDDQSGELSAGST